MKTEEKALARSVGEITASIRIRMVNVATNVIGIGRDLIELKESLPHGEWLPTLEGLGISSSTAGNYMRLAREIPEGSRLESLPYTKALALLAAPREDREEIAEAAEDKSAAEIRKLIEERNRAAEAANAETTRANRAEAALKNAESTIEALNDEKETTYSDLVRAEREIENIRGKLIEAENNRIEVVPEDYERLKRDREILTAAAEEAEERVAELERKIEELESGAGEPVSRHSNAKFIQGRIDEFFRGVYIWPNSPKELIEDNWIIRKDVKRVRDWCEAMNRALDEAEKMTPIEAESAVMIR